MNHYSKGYLLNHILILAKKYGFFKNLNLQKIEKFSRDISIIGWDFDCNPGEVFNKIGGEIGFCYLCQDNSEEFIDDVCEKCDNKLMHISSKARTLLLSKIQLLKLEGRQQERQKIAKNMLARNADLQFIQESTQLSDEELSRLH